MQESAENRRGGKSGEEDNGNYTKRHRTWYAPWKSYEVTYDKNGEKLGEEQFRVPEEWCAVVFSFVVRIPDADWTKFPSAGSPRSSPRV